jgi:very-short-patch-repair endonuclease
MRVRTNTPVARRLRQNSTEVGRRLWIALRSCSSRFKFRRPHPVGRRVVDFACPAAKLAIELDGGQHALDEIADSERTAELAEEGYRVIRFWNNEVPDNLDGVIDAIRQALDEPPPRPGPLRPGGRRGGGRAP